MVVGSPTKLNLIPSGVMPVVYINQGDAGYDKEFLVYNGDSPYNVPAGVSATIRGKKADGYGVTEAAALTTGSNLVTVTITEQMVAAEGANLYELVFVDTNGLRIATINMVWAVKKDALGDSVISDSDLDYVSQAMDRIQGADAMRAQMNANTAAISAETAARIAADNTLQNSISSEATTRETQDAVLSARMDTFASLPAGSTSGNAELLDIRVGANGTIYPSAGDAVRGQIDDLKSKFVIDSMASTPYVQGYLRTNDGLIGADPARCVSKYIYPEGESFTVHVPDGYVLEKICEYYGNKTFISTYANLNATGYATFSAISGHCYRFQVRKADSTALLPSSITDGMFVVAVTSTDITLTESGKAADSKTVGDSIGAFSVRTIQASDVFNGYIDFATGDVTNDTKRLGLNDRLHITCDTVIEFEYGENVDEVYIELYDKYNNLINHTTYINVNSIRINKDDAAYINLIFRNSSLSTIAPADFDASVYIIPSEDAAKKFSVFSAGVFFDAEIGSLSDTTGEPITGSDGVFRSNDFINTSDLTTITFKNQSRKNVYVYEYDRNKAFIQATSSVIAQGGIFSLSKNTQYIKLVVRIDTSTERWRFIAASLFVVGVVLEKVKIPMESGTYNSATIYSTNINNYNRYIINSYPVVVASNKPIFIFYNDSDNYAATIIFRNEYGTTISSTTCHNGESFTTPSGTEYVDIEIRAGIASADDVYLISYDTHSTISISDKRIAANGGNRISLVYRIEKSSDLISYANLLLPPNYSRSKKVPCILWMDGSGNMTTWGSSFSDKLPYLEYLRDEGFAVLSIFAWGYNYTVKYPNCGNAYPYPVPTNLAFIKAGLEYVCDKYNIDPENIHIMSKSQGGQCAYYFASHPIWNFKSIGMFAPVLDYLSMPGEAMYADTRKAIAEDLGLTGNVQYFTSTDYLGYSSDALAFWESNLHQIIGLNESYTNLNGASALENVQKSVSDSAEFWTDEAWNTPQRTDIYNHHEYKKFASIPVKIWGASDDSATPFFKMSEAVSQLQNGGTEAVLRTFNRGTGGHGCADVGSNYEAEVTTALGITHTNVRTGWIENIEWIRLHMAK